MTFFHQFYGTLKVGKVVVGGYYMVVISLCIKILDLYMVYLILYIGFIKKCLHAYVPVH